MHYFTNIKTELQSYILGWFWSRGNGRIQLSSPKREILYLIRDTLSPNKTISNFNNRYELNLSKYKSHLLQAGCVSNKHLSQTLPSLSPHLINHFLRGIFDSYGTIYLTKSKYPNISLVYDDCFIKKLRPFLLAHNIDTRHYYRYTHTNTIQMLITNRKSCTNLFYFLYYNSNYYLTRNFQKYQKYIEKSV